MKTSKVSMTWFKYITFHVIPTWFRSFRSNFVMWLDLMTDHYEHYAILEEDDPFECCYDWFWTSIGMDEVYGKDFLEYLMQMVDDIETGKVETIPFTEEMFNELKELTDDINRTT